MRVPAQRCDVPAARQHSTVSLGRETCLDRMEANRKAKSIPGYDEIDF
jgi:hypothetical protein